MDQPTSSASPTLAGRARRRVIIAALAIAAVGASTLAAARMGDDFLPGLHGRHGAHAAPDPAAVAAHIDKMVAKLLPDGTPEQKAKLAAIAKSAAADLAPVRAQLRAGHERAHALLMAPVVDRAALEQLRAEQIATLDAASKRMLTAVEDAADLLTPEQRQRFHAMLRKRVH